MLTEGVAENAKAPGAKPQVAQTPPSYAGKTASNGGLYKEKGRAQQGRAAKPSWDGTEAKGGS